MNDIKRISSGVVFESDVLRFINQLASDQQRTRSFIINQIVRHYARMKEHELKSVVMPAPGVTTRTTVISI